MISYIDELQASKTTPPGGSATLLGSTSVPCHNGMTVRSILKQDGNFWVYVDNWYYYYSGSMTDITSGQPGFGVRSAPTGNAIVKAEIGHYDTVKPSAPDLTKLATSTAPNRVDLSWAGTADDANGTGVSMYGVFRNGSLINWVTYPEFEDNTVVPSTTYSYQLYACDYHGNCRGASPFNATTPPAGSIDPRRVGIATLGSYWGGTGENIDMWGFFRNRSLILL